MENPNRKNGKWRQLVPGSKAVKGAVERHQQNGGCICKSVSHNTSVLSRVYYCDSCGGRIQ
jgi:hypothetical protein